MVELGCLGGWRMISLISEHLVMVSGSDGEYESSGGVVDCLSVTMGVLSLENSSPSLKTQKNEVWASKSRAWKTEVSRKNQIWWTWKEKKIQTSQVWALKMKKIWLFTDFTKGGVGYFLGGDGGGNFSKVKPRSG